MSEPRSKDDQPPSYDSLFGKIKQAKQESNGNIAFVQNVASITSNSLGFAVLLVILLIIPITCLVIGAYFIHDCPVQRYIPIHLVVMGVFTIVKDLSGVFQALKARKDGNQDEPQSRPNPFDSLISCFLFAWFICGNVWIYGTYNNFNSTNATAADFCHPTLFYFSFWLLNVTYIIIGLLFISCCACCLYICCMVKGTD